MLTAMSGWEIINIKATCCACYCSTKYQHCWNILLLIPFLVNDVQLIAVNTIICINTSDKYIHRDGPLLSCMSSLRA